MTTTHAKALGIGAAVLFFAAIGSRESQAQGVFRRQATPLQAVANMVTAPQSGYYQNTYPSATPYQTYAAPQPYAQGYNGWTTAQPTYQQPAYTTTQPAFRGYTSGQPVYQPTSYYQSGYNGYTQPQAAYPTQYQAPQAYQYVQPSTGNRYVDAARSVLQPNYQTAPTYRPQTVPMFTVPR